MNLEQQRQSAQLQFQQSDQNIVCGSLEAIPLTLDELKNTTANSPYVVETFSSGLTAIVYHLHVDGVDWTLKCQRPQSLVKNVDGETSFLNEVQRRRDLNLHKQNNPKLFKHIVDTQYASFRDGIILSPWIVGEPLQQLTKNIFEQVFATIVNLELSGLFEWDFCPGNILLTPQQQVRLFDFGYMYQFDPTQHFNSNGTDTPLFHGVERFETRFFFDYLLKQSQVLNVQQQFDLYRLEKTCALDAYLTKLEKLKQMNANSVVLTHHQTIIQTWQHALESDDALQDLMLVEQFRSNVLDLLDDIHGKSCSQYTLQKADFVVERIELHYELLKQKQGFFFGDESLTQAELINKYTALKQSALDFQIRSDTSI
ncbi:hypothetical protein EK599_02625 [Vibrio sp. T187]|uniref:hypothetical protein n=1 Tax=Vibrio TaxID=662 RepID=UPI0010C9C9D2|nr:MULTISPECIES: hypothetical protein [Vibrio]MBW3694569.1 hypothetical protein [Vibrio sp. T187]